MQLLIPVVRMELKGEEEHKDEERGDHAMLYALTGLFAVATLYLVVRAVRRGACNASRRRRRCRRRDRATPPSTRRRRRRRRRARGPAPGAVGRRVGHVRVA